MVVGPQPTMALVKLARLVEHDATDMASNQHYIQALVLQVSSTQLPGVTMTVIVSAIVAVYTHSSKEV